MKPEVVAKNDKPELVVFKIGKAQGSIIYATSHEQECCSANAFIQGLYKQEKDME